MSARRFFILAASCFIIIAVMILGSLSTPLARSGDRQGQGARSDYTPYSDWIEVNYDMTYVTSTSLSVNASFSVREIKMTGYDITTADDIRNISQGLSTVVMS